jgi:hypothetical protein
VREMKVGPSEPLYGGRFQTTDAAYRKSPVLLIESPHPGGVAG